MLSRDDILGFQDIRTEDVPVPEWSKDPANPESVRVRTLSAADRLRVVGTATDGVDSRVIWIVAALIDEKGEPLMRAEDVAAMMNKSARATDRIYDAVQRLNNIGAKAVDDAAKN